LLLISDLHLQDSRPDITRTLMEFLHRQAADCTRLYILGDLFEVWIGDDAPNPLADQVAAALLTLGEAGTEIYLMHGNRDFLMGQDFAARCGVSLVEEPLLLTVGEQRIALLHGDVLCTDDTAYLRFREMVRNPDWQREFLSRPLAEREEFARQARDQSRQASLENTPEIMDVTDTAVTSLMQELQVDTLIHGHTHRPAVHDLILSADEGSRRRQRVVLGDWDRHGWYGEIDERGDVSLHRFPLAD